MSILNVEHLTHGFGDRAIFEDVSFRLLKGEHVGLIGANGEGKSSFMNIIIGKLPRLILIPIPTDIDKYLDNTILIAASRAQ